MASVPPEVVVRVPLTVRVFEAVSEPEVLSRVRLLYVPDMTV